MVCHGANGFSLATLKPVKYSSDSLRPHSFQEPFDVSAGESVEGFEAEGRVFDDDGGGEEGVS